MSQIGARAGDSFLSPDLQRERIEAWAAYRQHDLVSWYVDLDVSGREGVRRPEFERMMVDAQAGRFDIVAVYRLTRFGRSVKDTAGRYAELRDLGIGLVSVTEDIDTTTAGGQFMRNMLFAMAEFESQRIGEEWRGVHANRRRRGLAQATRGIFGYRVEGSVPAAVEPAEARAVREIYQRRAGGATIGQLRSWLADEGYRPKRGGSMFPVATIGKMLRNPVYAGLVQAGDELVDGTHEAIVSRDLWDQVQRLHGRTTKLNRYRSGLGSGLVRCAGCGFAMTAWQAQGLTFYRCTAFRQSHDCPAPTAIGMRKLDEHLEHAFLRRARRLQVKPVNRKASRWEERTRTLTARVEELSRALDQLTDHRFRAGVLSDEEYQRQTERILKERARAQADLEEAQALMSSERPRVVEFEEAWPRLPLQRRQTMLRRLVREVRVKPGRRGGPQPPITDRVDIEWIT